jgi:uncharacterized membrane protein (UPF0127 family)
VLAVALLVGACGAQPGTLARSGPSPASPPAADLPLATLPDGFAVELELALTAEEVARGLMYRPSLPANRGMLFVFEETRNPTFWMKNTRVPLDIVFLDEGGAVVQVEADAPPCAAEPCPRYTSQAPARAVLELAAGSAAQHGVVAGARLRFARVTGYPLTS